ncbi:MAG TPA: Fur family transcriptional regulator [Candidatus Limnocylindrales bacterium]|nr:Fur family transcriptional regulator [Candidatus Limnocylindrales bacterium]
MSEQAAQDRWADVRSRLRAAGLRWTPQRGVVLDVLADVDGHVTGAELVERSRRIDPETTPSTVYRTLDVLEELGVVAHSHGREGRQEFHVNPVHDHGHLVCSGCGHSWELDADEVRPLVEGLKQQRGFAVSVDHLTVEGRCATCTPKAG